MRLRSRLRALWHPGRIEREVNEELAQHLDRLIEQNLASGMTPEEARSAALKEFGGLELARQECREALGTRLIGDLAQDLRLGWRGLVKRPGFMFVAILTLALGIGANTVIFSVVDSVLFEPLSYGDPGRLVMVWEENAKKGYPRDTPAAANFIDWRDQNKVFDGMSATAPSTFNLTGSGEPERLEGERVSANFFELLGVRPTLGRSFLDQEDQAGAPRAVIISHGLWQRRFGADPGLLGQPIRLDGESYIVVGIMPAGFDSPRRDDVLWVPLALSPDRAANRSSHYLRVFARMKPGVSLEQARAEMSGIALGLQQQYPDSNHEVGAVVVPLQEQLVGDIKPTLLILLGAVGFVLLIACANVANLLLVRSAARCKETSIRVALGASRSRLIRQFMTESLVLSVLGGAAGVMLAAWVLNLLLSFVPAGKIRVERVAIDLTVLAAAVLISVLIGLVFGMAPVAQSRKSDLNAMLKEGGRDSSESGGSDRLRRALVVVEVAISLVLLIGAGLLLSSFVRILRLDPGFRSDNLLTVGLVLPQRRYPELAQRGAFYTDVVEKVEALPGVRSAAVTNWIPLVPQGDSTGVSVQGYPEPARGSRPSVTTRIVGPGYFRTMGINLIKGRTFDASIDRADGHPVVVVSEAMARRFWPGGNAVGGQMTPDNPASGRWYEVIGVVNDVRQFDLTSEPGPQIYFTYDQYDMAGVYQPRFLVVRTEREPLALADALRRIVWGIDRDQPVSDVRSMTDVMGQSMALRRFTLMLLGLFAILALALASVGIYGVMSYSVAQRTREIGIRMALGADTLTVVRLIVGQGMRLVLIGIAAGIAGALALTRLMQGLLYGVSATDPATFLAIPLLLSVVALLACYLPARRATKIDQVTALRYE